MKDIKIGDLVRIVSEWTMHNPWMKLAEDEIRIGLVVGLGHGTRNNAIILIGKFCLAEGYLRINFVKC